MKLITPKTHAYLDYIVGIFLLVAPFTFHLARRSPEGLIFFILGAGLLIYSMITNYELGLFKIIPMKVHLLLDVLSGIILAASPWLLGFSDRVYLPHLIVGLFEIGAGLLTSSKPKPSL
ncbi:SPW repeat protein [Flavobacterium piscis]|uniref:Asparagine N-glycosylation enzyme membrane subunit Stt3 n=1 Tax=Flavobacterium piscis TaxID=1114874 RepID=A0ABU1YA75_9FLAO|nr:SPW repeat protein [Flavobacterium piscis]MDR7211048.1 asparagine N-glycosylation enzyme membrane subunit Stt3 [Flavobacterium piscis]